MQSEPLNVNDEEIAKALALKPQLHFPCKIAVHMAHEGGSWRWSAKDKQMLEVWAKELIDQGIASDVFFISDMFVDKEQSNKSLRLAAAKHGADALLTIRGVAQVDEYVNPLAVFNLSVVGAYVIPASHRDALFMMRGALIDVGNGYLYATAETEGVGSVVRPTLVIDNKAAIEQAKEAAVSQFGKEITTRVRRLYDSYPKRSEPGRTMLDMLDKR
jgi:hypothetical protein